MADEILEQVTGMVDDIRSFKTKAAKDLAEGIKEAKAEASKATAEIREAYDLELKALKEQVGTINSEAALKGATVLQLQEELAEYKAKKGKAALSLNGEYHESTREVLKQAFADNFEQINKQATRPKANFEFELKAAGVMTGSASLTGAGFASYAGAPALRGRQKVHFRDLVDVVSTSTGLWKFYRQNTPVGEGSFDTQSTHGAVKSQLDYDFTEVTVTVDYLAGFVRIAKQMLQDLPFMQSFVNNELVEDYLRAEDMKFFGQVYSGATGSSAGITSSVTIEKIIQGVASLGEQDYDANGIAITNVGWARVLLTKPNDYSLPGGGQAVTITSQGEVAVLGIPLVRVKESYIGAGRMIIGDWTKAKIIQSEGLNVNVYEQDSDNVQRNLVTVKAEARVALALLRPDAFIVTTIGTT